jgi:hypothetical protein
MNCRGRECRRWGKVRSIWWDSSFSHLNDQAKNTIGQRSSILAQWPPWKSQELKKPRLQWKIAKWFCKICSMCENMISCVKIWLSMDICVKYAQCVKIWLFVLKFDFQWIFVWNMLIVWKYYHLRKKLTFIGYLCEICSMFENMAICVKMWILLDICVKYAQCVKIWPLDVLVLFLKCVLFLKSCVQFLMDTILNLAIVQFLIKKKGDAPTKCVSRI